MCLKLDTCHGTWLHGTRMVRAWSAYALYALHMLCRRHALQPRARWPRPGPGPDLSPHPHPRTLNPTPSLRLPATTPATLTLARSGAAWSGLILSGAVCHARLWKGTSSSPAGPLSVHPGWARTGCPTCPRCPSSSRQAARCGCRPGRARNWSYRASRPACSSSAAQAWLKCSSEPCPQMRRRLL
jgi:hypothetical protein